MLRAYAGPLPRLAYITDKGSAPEGYYRRVLKKMKHPREGQLEQRVLFQILLGAGPGADSIAKEVIRAVQAGQEGLPDPTLTPSSRPRRKRPARRQSPASWAAGSCAKRTTACCSASLSPPWMRCCTPSG